MTTLLRLALILVTALAFLSGSARAEDSDPAPVLDEFATADDGRHYAGIFDFVRSRRAAPSCANGNCPTDSALVAVADAPKSTTAPAPAAKAAPTPAVTTSATTTSTPLASAFRARRFRPVANLLESVITWYPGRAFARVRSRLCD